MMRFSLALLSLALFAPAQKKVDFGRQIRPILEKNCVECHKAPYKTANGRLKKPKGRVRFDTRTEMIKSKRGRLVKAGKPDDSLLYEVISLPADDEDRMPPPDEADPLTPKQIELIRRWIEEGGDYGKWTGEPKGKATSLRGRSAPKARPAAKAKGPTLGEVYEALAKTVRPLSPEALEPFAQSAFLIRSVGDDMPLLAVSCYGESEAVDDARLEELLPLADHIVELDLARTEISDEAGKIIARMKNLVELDVRGTAFGNHGAAALTACRKLRSLNFFGTEVGDYGITALSELADLREIYLWQSRASEAGIARLRKALPTLRVVEAPKLPAPMEELPDRRRRRR